MRIRSALATLCLAMGWLAACSNEIEVSPAAPKVEASLGVQGLVAEIDAMLVVPQSQYPNGDAFSAVFEQLFDEVVKQKRTLRTNKVSQNMGYFIAHGHGIGWNPKEADIASLARDWHEFRPDVLAGP